MFDKKNKFYSMVIGLLFLCLHALPAVANVEWIKQQLDQDKQLRQAREHNQASINRMAVDINAIKQNHQKIMQQNAQIERVLNSENCTLIKEVLLDAEKSDYQQAITNYKKKYKMPQDGVQECQEPMSSAERRECIMKYNEVIQAEKKLQRTKSHLKNYCD